MTAPAWDAPPAAPRLAPGDVHVWRAPLDVVPADAAARTLAESELTRARAFHRDADRARFLVARHVIRDVLARYVHADPAALTFTRACTRCGDARHGKPRLTGPGDAAARVRFNASHAGNVLLLAVTRDAEVGVDVEPVRALPERDSITASFFTPAEARLIADALPAERDAAFLVLWTRKEAVLKLTGAGIVDALARVDASRDVHADHARVPGVPDAGDVTVHRADPYPGHTGAVTVDGDARVTAWWTWDVNRPST